MHTDIVDLLVQYKLIRSSGLQSGHVPSHLNGHPLMRDSFMGMKPQGRSSLFVLIVNRPVVFYTFPVPGDNRESWR